MTTKFYFLTNIQLLNILLHLLLQRLKSDKFWISFRSIWQPWHSLCNERVFWNCYISDLCLWLTCSWQHQLRLIGIIIKPIYHIKLVEKCHFIKWLHTNFTKWVMSWIARTFLPTWSRHGVIIVHDDTHLQQFSTAVSLHRFYSPSTQGRIIHSTVVGAGPCLSCLPCSVVTMCWEARSSRNRKVRYDAVWQMNLMKGLRMKRP